ncbi:hypothetical protein T484DRAFT_1841641, partial [Baffinella frigidus]
ERLIFESPPGPASVANTVPTSNAPATHVDDAAPHRPDTVASYALVVDSDSVSIPATEERASFMGTSSQSTHRPSGPDDVGAKDDASMSLHQPHVRRPSRPNGDGSDVLQTSSFTSKNIMHQANDRLLLSRADLSEEEDKFKLRDSSVRTIRRRSLSVWLDALNSERDEDAGGQDARCSSAAASREEATESASADTDTKQEDTTYVRQRRPS